jgi:hypothetical protein
METSEVPQAYGAKPIASFPNILPYEVGTQTAFGFVEWNGRALADNAPDVMFSIAANTPASRGIGKEQSPRSSFRMRPPQFERQTQGESCKSSQVDRAMSSSGTNARDHADYDLRALQQGFATVGHFAGKKSWGRMLGEDSATTAGGMGGSACAWYYCASEQSRFYWKAVCISAFWWRLTGVLL